MNLQTLNTRGQGGGTLLGFVMGLVLGLAVALAVAVYVTKVPVPFMNRSQARTAEQDAAENRKNKDWDPNTPLYGKNPARAASVPAVPPPAAPASGKPAPSASVPAGVAAAVKAASKPPAADPLGDFAKARSAAAPASAPLGTEPFTYFVQVGAFRTPEDAEGQRAKMSLGGIEAKISEREQSGRMVYRVRVGPFDKKEDADRIKEKLDASGQETALVRVQR